MKSNELRAKNNNELSKELTDLLKAQFGLRMQLATQQLTNTSQMKKVRRDIARVRTMMKEHDAAGEALRSLREASHGYTAPQDACVSYRELYKSLQAFEANLHTHVHLENNILFPRALAREAQAAAA